MPWSFRRNTADDERERIIRRVAQLNAEVTRLQQIADEPDGEFDEVEAYRSVRRLRSAMAREELLTQRSELDLLAARLARLDGALAPTGPDFGVALPAVAASASAVAGTFLSRELE